MLCRDSLLSYLGNQEEEVLRRRFFCVMKEERREKKKSRKKMKGRKRKKEEGQRRKRGSTNENQEKVSSQEKWPLKWHLYSTRFSDSWLPLSFFEEKKILRKKRMRRRGRRCENQKRKRQQRKQERRQRFFSLPLIFNTSIVLSDGVVVKIKIFKTYFSVNDDNNEEKIEERTLSVSLSRLFS